MLRFGVGEGGGRRRCRKSRAYLWKNPGHASACIVQGWRKTLFFCTQGLSNYSSDVFRVVVEDTPKFVRIRSDSLSSKAMNGSCDFWMEILCPDRFQYTSTTELNCEPWNAFPFVCCSGCLQKDVNVFSTKGNVSRNGDLKNIPVAVTCT